MQRLFSPLLALFVLSRLVAQDPSFVHEFGAPGARGSFRASFDDRGAGLFFLQTMDHFTAPAAAWRAHEVRVISEPLASDHRPVLAVLELLVR